jgi:hypothetical protein
LEKVSGYTVDSRIKGMADLSLHLEKALTDLASQLTSETNKLSELQQAIAIETRALEELHDIRLVADTLALLIQDHEEKKAAFEKEMEESETRFEEEVAAKRLDWKKEQEAYTAVLKEVVESVNGRRIHRWTEPKASAPRMGSVVGVRTIGLVGDLPPRVCQSVGGVGN